MIDHLQQTKNLWANKLVENVLEERLFLFSNPPMVLLKPTKWQRLKRWFAEVRYRIEKAYEILRHGYIDED